MQRGSRRALTAADGARRSGPRRAVQGESSARGRPSAGPLLSAAPRAGQPPKAGREPLERARGAGAGPEPALRRAGRRGPGQPCTSAACHGASTLAPTCQHPPVGHSPCVTQQNPPTDRCGCRAVPMHCTALLQGCMPHTVASRSNGARSQFQSQRPLLSSGT